MATRKMTFSLPSGLAVQFLKRVPARERSRYVADALAYQTSVIRDLLNKTPMW